MLILEIVKSILSFDLFASRIQKQKSQWFLISSNISHNFWSVWDLSLQKCFECFQAGLQQPEVLALNCTSLSSTSEIFGRVLIMEQHVLLHVRPCTSLPAMFADRYYPSANCRKWQMIVPQLCNCFRNYIQRSNNPQRWCKEQFHWLYLQTLRTIRQYWPRVM